MVKDGLDNGTLLLHKWNGSLREYGKTGIDKNLENLAKRTSVRFSNHDLRRTCGRRMFNAELKIEEIASIFGHEDTKITLKYLGLDHDDLTGAMDLYYQMDQRSLFPKTEIINESQCESGQGGI